MMNQLNSKSTCKNKLISMEKKAKIITITAHTTEMCKREKF